MENFTKLVLLIFFVINYSESSTDIQILNFQNENIHVPEQQINSSFKIVPKKGINLPNYLRIFVKGYNETKVDVNHIISYYQDEDLEDRKQLSQSLYGTTTMWLTKKQIENEFYLTVDCFEKPCNYTIDIMPKDICELSLHEQLTYYITEENKEMKFKISGTPIISDVSESLDITNKNVITITAKGSKKIESTLEGVEGLNYVKHSKYEAYLVELQKTKEFEEIEFTLTVKGQLGDLITLGSFFADGTTYNLCPVKNEKNGFEYTGFLKKNYKSQNCFRIKNYAANYGHISYSWDNIELVHTFQRKALKDGYRVVCMNLPTGEYDEIFYTFHFILFSKIQKELIKYPVSYLGYNYRRFLWPNETIGVLAVQPDNDFNYLTYNVNNTYGSIKASLITCYNYPFCEINKDVFSKGTPLINYNSFSFSFNKTEISNKMTSISKKQNILLFYCDKEFKEQYCALNQNIYSDKEISFIAPNTIYSRYSRENNIEGFEINEKNDNNIKVIYLNIEKYTGDINITINFKDYKEFSYENKKLFIIKGESIKFTFFIKSNQNSVYSLSYCKGETVGPFMPGANYLLNLKDFKNELYFTVKLNDQYLNSNTYKYYYGLYPINNCALNVKKENKLNKNYEVLEEKNGFFNDIFVAKDRDPLNTTLVNYNLNKKVENDEECLFYISIFHLDDYPDFNKIVLNNNYSRLFLFNENNYNMNYIYPIMDLENDVIINLNFVNTGKYHMSLSINERNFANYSVIDSQKIEVSSTTFVNYCDKRMNQLCKLSVNILSEEYDKESVLNITVNSNIKEVIPPSPIIPPSPNPSNNEKAEEKNNTSSFAAILGISLLVIIIAIIAIIILLKCRRKGTYIEMIPANQEMILQG